MTATYIYAVTAEPVTEGLNGLAGVGREALRFVDADGMACLVSTVELSEFGEEVLQRNLEDLVWLERTARAHDNVRRAVAAVTPTLPLRLATVCTDDASARRRVNEFSGVAREALATIAGHDELGVKLFVAPNVPTAESVESPASSGARYLHLRRQQLQAQGESADRVLRLSEEIFESLSALSSAARRHRPHDRRLTGDARPMVLNAAFLVARDQQDSFRAAIDVLTEATSRVSAVVTGPWPAYSFAPEPIS